MRSSWLQSFYRADLPFGNIFGLTDIF